ncbi:hypothetical protein [Microbulbifer sp. SAOS-129_SWC]|uniref:hypothetical protein n=1 Tax=Microbulbifer sp. SAOS-129_SWC TaxID=3145235 RepID=UPI003216C19B
MNMFSVFKDVVGTVFNKKRTAARFRSVAPVRFWFDVFTSFSRNILQLLVFILPIKVVIVVSNPKLPGFLERIWPGLGRGDWLLVLSSIIVLSFLSTIFLEWYLERSGDCYNRKFSREHKKERFANRELLSNVYRRVVESGSGTLLLLALSAGIAFLYPDFLVFFYFSLFVVVLMFSVIALQVPSFPDKFRKNPSRFVGKGTGVLFIMAFCYIVYDFWRDTSAPPLFSAVVAVILSRRLLAALSRKISDVVWFARKKNEILRLFYRGHEESEQSTSTSKQVVDFLAERGVQDFAESALAAFGLSDSIGEVSDVRWHDSPVPWLNLLDFSCARADGEESGRVLLKVYETQRGRVAREEQVLYAPLENAGLMPEFIGSAKVHGSPVHAFWMSEDWGFSDEREDVFVFKGQLVSLELDEDTVEQYKSEHPVLPERLSASLVQRLNLVLAPQEQGKISRFLRMLPALNELVKQMPLRLHVPDGVIKCFLANNGGALQLLGLGEWKIEPLGYGLPISTGMDGALEPHANAVGVEGEALFPGEVEYVTSRLAELESCCLRKRLSSGLSIIDELSAEGSIAVRVAGREEGELKLPPLEEAQA